MYTPNPITAFDFYKADHRSQYPKGTDMVYSNFTPRSARLAKVIHDQFDNKVVFFSLQAFVMKFFIEVFNRDFFGKPKEEVVRKFKRRMDTSLGPNAVTVEHIAALHDLGYLPIEIRALPEGSRVDIRVPVFTIHNTLPEFFWLTNSFETVLSMFTWKGCTSATIAFEYKKMLVSYARHTGGDEGFVPFQAHDFSMRGMAGFDDAMMSGGGHCTSFTGSDTVPAIDWLEEFYLANCETEFIAGSIPATEHSVMCMGQKESELETYRRLITEVYPSGMVSIVSDTWDYWNVLTQVLSALKDSIMSREGKVVIRPDSGDPVRIICGYNVGTDPFMGDGEVYPNKEGDKFFLQADIDNNEHGDTWIKAGAKPLSEAEVKGSIQLLWELFGGTETSKGFKLLDSHIGLIYGDSITLERAHEILKRLTAKGFASTNVVFGVGSYTYEYQTRDSFGFAMKATAGSVNGEAREIFKDPVTDRGEKKSAKGLLRVEKNGKDFVLHDQQTWEQAMQGEMRVVFRDGQMYNVQSLADIRARLAAELV